MKEVISFRGNLITWKFILVPIFSILLVVFLFGLLYFFCIRDWFFYFIPSLSFILPILCLIGITISALKFVEQKFVKGIISLSFTSECLEIFKDETLYKNIVITDIDSFAWKQNKTKKYNQLIIRSEHQGTIRINVGGFFEGINDLALDKWVTTISKLLEKKINSKKQNITADFFIIKKNKKNEKSQSIVKKIVKKFTILIVMVPITISSCYILTVYVFGDDDPDNQVSRYGDRYEGSNYYLYEKEIYFLNIGNGYFRLKEADYKTFAPLNNGQHGSNMGMDSFNIFFDTTPIKAIDRKHFRYIGAYYTADSSTVFYKDIPLEKADPNTFELVSNSSNPEFPYGKDRYHVYYKSSPMDGLNPNRIKLFDQTNDYICDDNVVYYKGNRMDANAESFYAEYVDYKLTLAKDNSSFWVNGLKFPKKVQNRFLGTTAADHSSLQLFEKKGEGSSHIIFYDKNHIFYFDEQKQNFYLIESIETSSFKKIGNGVYSYQGDIYYLSGKTLRSRKSRGYGGGSYAIQTKLNKLDKVKESDLKLVKQLKHATIWTDGKLFFTHLDSADSALLVIKDDMVEDIDNLSYISEEMTESPIADGSLFTIITRPEWH